MLSASRMETITRPISTHPGCGLCTYTPYPHLRLCMHHHISFRPKLAIVHSDTAGLQHEATLAIRQPFCFSSIAAIISSIMSIPSKSSGCLKSSQVTNMSYTRQILTHNYSASRSETSSLLLPQFSLITQRRTVALAC